MNNVGLLRRFILIITGCMFAEAQIVTDPLPYSLIANPLPDTMDQLYRDSVNIKFSPIRINQAGYRPQDKKYFYYIGSGASVFSVINEAGSVVGNGTLSSTGLSCSGQLKIKASNNAQLVHNGDTRYTMQSPIYSGPIYEGIIPDLPPGVYRIVVGNNTSARFVIDERVYSWVRDALLKFYGVNRCGDSKSWFHPPCHLKDAVTGGWHDCGDHLKEGATMSYTAAVLGLAAAAFADRDQDVYDADQGITQITDGIPDILYEAKHGADFVLRSYDKAGGQVRNMITSIGDFGYDHMWWGRPENQDNMPTARGGPPRAARNEVGADYIGGYAANLAFVSKRIRPYDPQYADRCLKASKDLYEFAKRNQVVTNTPAYNGSTIVADDIAFAALGLLWATGDRKYLDELCFDKTIGEKAQNNPKALFEGGWFARYDPIFYHSYANTDWASVHAHVLWGFFRLILNDKETAASLGLSENQRLSLIEKTIYNLIANLASVGQGTQRIELPQGGIWTGSAIAYDLPWFTMFTQMEWVWNRYQAGNITEMFYYYDIASKIQGLELPNTPASTNWKAQEVKNILIRMLDYMLGVNPWDISMIYGVGEKNFNHPHHRAANPEGKNVPGAFYRYFPPVGALQGGYKPTTSLYDEFWADYFHSETGIDGTTNIFMPVVGLAKEDTVGPPSATVRIIYVGCNEAIIEIRQTRYGRAEIHYGTNGRTYDKVVKSDSTGVFHRITLSGLSNGTTYNFKVVVSDMFGRDSVVRYLDEEKKLVDFTFTTLQNCPTNARITNVKVCRVTHDSAEIFWYTPNGEFDSRVVYGTQKPPTTVQNGDVTGHPVKFHYVKIGNLKEKTTYYFYVESGDSRDDNNGQLYQFTTPVEHVEFDVRTLRYTWGGKPAMGVNIVNQDVKAYDSLELRIYFRDKEGFEKDLGARIDIMVLYREDGYQDTITGDLRQAIWSNLATQKPQKIPDTYDPSDGTYAYYFTIPLWGVQMRSQSRIRMDVVFVRWEPERGQDLLDEPPLHKITDRDWSFGPHSTANGDPVDYPGMPVLPKEEVDASYFTQPINYYVTIYRKGEYVWGYSPSQAELKTKKNYYNIVSQITSPLNNPSADYVFYERSVRIVDVSGWAKVEPFDGTINDIWVNGVRQNNLSSLLKWNEKDERYDFTIPVPVQNGRNNVDITFFAGPPIECVDCYGCAVSNHHFYIEFQGAKQYPSLLVLKDENMQPLSDTVKLDTTRFNVFVTDKNGNQNGKAADVVKVWIKNIDNGDSIEVILTETGDSTGIFQTTAPISVVGRTPAESGNDEIAMNGGDRVRIWYIDPTDPTDSSEVFIVSRANFPVARRGWLKDSDGDGSADMMVVEYSIPLKQNVDSLRINFPNASTATTAKPGADEITFNVNILTVRFGRKLPEGVTGFTSALYTSGTSYLTYGGAVRTSVFNIYDSIALVLNDKAIVRERIEAGNDTITITFSESVRLDKLQGKVLLLRRGGVDYPLDVLGIFSSETGSYTLTVICNSGGTKFTAGDSVRLNSQSELADLSGNKPHPANRGVPVFIKAGMPRVDSAYYYDADLDGRIDLVRIYFSKPVNPEQLTVALKWNGGSRIVIDNSRISASAGSSNAIDVALDTALTTNEIATSGLMSGIVMQTAFTGDTVMFEVKDRAAPVIASARFTLFNGDITKYPIVDTLRVVFSEIIDAQSAANISFFNLLDAEMVKYTFNVSSYRMIDQRQYLFTGISQGKDYPHTGDLIWIPAEAGVTDPKGNTQSSDNNRKAPVVVDDIAFSLKDMDKVSGPNPFNPPAEKFQMYLRPKATRFPFRIDSSAQAIVYDQVGNVVNRLLSREENNGIVIEWNGTNRHGRIVGDGTYVLYLFYKGGRERIMVGVVSQK